MVICYGHTKSPAHLQVISSRNSTRTLVHGCRTTRLLIDMRPHRVVLAVSEPSTGCCPWLRPHHSLPFPELSKLLYQFQLALGFIASVGKDRQDGGRNENSVQCVNSAVFGSDLGFVHGHVVCQNLPLREEALVSSILTAGPRAIPRQMRVVTASPNRSV